MVDTNTNAFTEVQLPISNGASNNTSKGKQGMSTGRSKAKRELPLLLTSGQQERKSLKLQGSVSANAQTVANSKFPLHTTFVINPDSSELFIKLDKHTITSLFSGQRYSSQGISGYLVNLA